LENAFPFRQACKFGASCECFAHRKTFESAARRPRGCRSTRRGSRFANTAHRWRWGFNVADRQDWRRGRAETVRSALSTWPDRGMLLLRLPFEKASSEYRWEGQPIAR